MVNQVLAKNKNKRSSQVNIGQKVQDIDIDKYFEFFEKVNRKNIEKAYTNIKF